MLYDLSNPYEVQKFRSKVDEMVSRKEVCELKARRLQRTTNQNSYLHLLLGYFAQEFGYTLDEVKVDIFKRQCNADIFIVQRKNKRGQMVQRLRSSASLTTEELSLAIDRFKQYSASECGLYLPDSDEHKALLWAQKQIDNYKQYI